MASTTDRTYCFGRFELDPATRELRVDGRPAHLGARAFDLLHVLVEHRDRLVTKGELLDLVWPGVVVEENNLAAQVAAVRKVLGPQAIATIPGRGYRFVAALQSDERRQDKKPPEAAGAGGSARLIGRETDTARIQTMLASERLVTIVGTGGIGKTRLAKAVVADGAGSAEFCWIELAPISDPALIVDTIAAALGMGAASNHGGIDELAKAAQRKRATLVLDNGEHLIESLASAVARLLEGGSSLRFLVTSREPLKIASEVVYRLEGLAMAHTQELFLARATAIDHRFRVAEGQRPILAEICRRLDGIPLAIEFAAARAPLLGLARLHDQIERSMEGLASSARDGAARQRTLQATLDWSHQLLTEVERRYFRRLSVFCARFTLDLAREVAADDPSDEWESNEILATLVEKSMVAMDAADPPRYSLLETTRMYGLQHLARAGEEGETRRRHALCLARRFEAFQETWLEAPEREWHPAAAALVDDYYAALSWCFAPQGDLDLGSRLAAAGVEIVFLIDRRQRTRILAWLERAIAHVDASAQPRRAAHLWLGKGYFMGFVDMASTRDADRRAAAYFREAGDEIGLVDALVESARAALWSGDFAAAEQLLQEARAGRTSTRAPILDGVIEIASGLVHSNRGRPHDASESYRRAAEVFARHECETLLLIAGMGLADSLWTSLDLDGAEAGFRQTLDRLRQDGHVRSYQLAVNLGNLAGVLVEKGSTDEALVLAREALPIFFESGRIWSIVASQALRLALGRRHESAARLVGYCDASTAAANRSLEINAKRLHARALQLVTTALEGDELRRLMREGTALSDEEAGRIAIEV